MIFDLYEPFRNKSGKWCPGVKPNRVQFAVIWQRMNGEDVEKLLEQVRNGDKGAKVQLPAVCWTGLCGSGYRRDSDMTPTQFIMIDIDHVYEPSKVFDEFFKVHETRLREEKLSFVHVTPSGRGLRLVFQACHEIETLSEYMLYLDETFGFHKIGDFDPSVKNLGRLSFLVSQKDALFCSPDMFREAELEETYIVAAGESITQAVKKRKEESVSVEKDDKTQQSINFEGGVQAFTSDEKSAFDAFRYRGFELPTIIKKYVETYGEPGSGERHNYFNEMVKNFRCITDNNKRLLLYYLPDFGHTLEERWSQIVSICRVNTLSRLPKSFYFFLKDNGFYESRNKSVSDLKDYMLEENNTPSLSLPYLPPVFREFIRCTPKDFVVPMVNAMLPILGTLTSYARAIYPYDNREHSTSFFSVIYAPPGTGKGFVERLLDLLFEDLRLRDFVESERENVYLRVMQRKGANDKAPEMPHVSLRLIPPKNSEAEFLQKQRDNNGYHMFTYAAEMDSWAKGVRAAGGNKDDMIRIAWDNGEYGQQFKSVNTFKGTVRLYWNVLITGTIQQVESYFKNVENGLVTRCSFCSIDNQEFALPPVWKNLSKREFQVVKKFMKRCDANTYVTPCTVVPEDLLTVSDDDFDKEVDWRFKFKEKKIIDMSWLMPIINEFHSEQMKLAAKDIDRARDVFRRRVAVRGFRLGMICHCLWENPKSSDLAKCCEFIKWWMNKDLENMLNLWGTKYNEQAEVVQHVVQRTVYDSLEDTFSRDDVYVVCVKQGIKTPVRRIVHDWKKLGYIGVLDKDHYVKIKPGKGDKKK